MVALRGNYLLATCCALPPMDLDSTLTLTFGSRISRTGGQSGRLRTSDHRTVSITVSALFPPTQHRCAPCPGRSAKRADQEILEIRVTFVEAPPQLASNVVRRSICQRWDSSSGRWPNLPELPSS